MANYLSPIGNEAQIDSNGNPLSGGKIYTYAAGTTTAATTYTEDGVAQANPVVLNSNGLPANAIWLQGGQAYKFVITNSADSQQRTVDDITGVNDPAVASTSDQWVLYTGTVTYSSSVAFRVAGDQTNVFQIGRRLKVVVTGGTGYGTVFSSSYNAGTGLTTVGFMGDTIQLDSGLSSVSYGLLSVSDPSFVALREGISVAASGTSIDFTSIPPWVKRVTVNFDGLSTNGTSNPIVQIGDSGGVETSGYLGSTSQLVNGATCAAANFTTGFGVNVAHTAATVIHGSMVISRLSSTSFNWAATMTGGLSNAAAALAGGGSKSLSAKLDRVRITTAGGADTFDAGSVNILYE